MTIELAELLAQADRLPSLPLAVQEIIRSFDNDQLDAATLANKISQDTPLAAKTLKLANSPFYGLSGDINSIQEAVMVLGFGTVRTLAVSAGIIGRFQLPADSGFDAPAFWQHNLNTAVFSRALAKLLKRDSEIAFAAGLLHDIGKLVIAFCRPAEFAEILAHQQQTGCASLEAERAVLGMDHAEIGAETAKKWHFPIQIQTAIRHHHAPDIEPTAWLTDVIHIADAGALCLEEGACTEQDFMARVSPGSWRRPGLYWNKLEASLPTIRQLQENAKPLLAA